jgi:glycosyltransferase involved in cell wall biosynthesis
VPAVSVIIPAYRAAAHLPQALESVFGQTRTDWEVLVVNDGCPETDELELAIEPYRRQIRYLVRENGGPGAARNTGIAAARAPFVAFLDADDFWEPDFIERQLDFLERNPSVDLVYTDGVRFRDGQCRIGTLMEYSPSVGEPTLEALLAERCTVNTSSVVVRREWLLSVGMFDESIGSYSEDYDLYLRLAYAGARLAYQRRLLMHHRDHGESLTAAPLRLSEGMLRVLEKARGYADLSERERAALETTAVRVDALMRLERGKLALACGNFRVARTEVRAAYLHLRSAKLWLVLLALRYAPATLRRMQVRRVKNSPA